TLGSATIFGIARQDLSLSTHFLLHGCGNPLGHQRLNGLPYDSSYLQSRPVHSVQPPADALTASLHILQTRRCHQHGSFLCRKQHHAVQCHHHHIVHLVMVLRSHSRCYDRRKSLELCRPTPCSSQRENLLLTQLLHQSNK